MSDEVRGAFELGLEILIFSMLILIIFFFSTYARNALVIKSNQDSGINREVQYRKVYQFSMGKEVKKGELSTPYTNLTEGQVKNISNIVTGDDIVRLVGLYPNEFNVYIKKASSTNGTKTILRTDDLNKWDIVNLNAWLGIDIGKEFYCVFVYDETQYIYDSVVFIMKSS